MSSAAAQSEQLAEIDVDKASAQISSIYEEIARLSAIPLPALIWRHLATYPGVLPEIWTALRPLYVRGLPQEAAWRTARKELDGYAAGPDRHALRALGLSPDEISQYRSVLQSYNRANPMNFMGVRLLLARMESSAPVHPTAPSDPHPWLPPAPITTIPPMVPVVEISPDLRAIIADLAIDADIDRSRIVPSLYRHLVPWPELVKCLHAGVKPLIRSGDAARLRGAVAAALDAEATKLAAHVGDVPTLSTVPGVRDVLERFSGLIPEMVVIGAVLSNAVDGGGDAG